jgi:hypothetical protein
MAEQFKCAPFSASVAAIHMGYTTNDIIQMQEPLRSLVVFEKSVSAPEAFRAAQQYIDKAETLIICNELSDTPGYCSLSFAEFMEVVSAVSYLAQGRLTLAYLKMLKNRKHLQYYTEIVIRVCFSHDVDLCSQLEKVLDQIRQC